MRFLVVIMVVLSCAVRAETVHLPGPDGVILNAELYPAQTKGKTQAPGVVALHGCAGPYPSRDYDWARRLAAAGHTVLLPDSFGSRGLGSQCGVRNRSVSRATRRQDALTALAWLKARPGVPPGGLVLMGWSDGGTTVLAAGGAQPDLPAGLIRGLIAFYPGCRGYFESKKWEPAAPMLIMIGESDDWTPAAPCQSLAEKFPGKITIKTYPGAYHDFDAPDLKIRVHAGLASPESGSAHTGTDPAAREDAIKRVPAFIAALPPAP